MENKPGYYCRRKGPFIFLFIVAGIFGLTAFVMLLWNEIMPGLINASPLSYWHAMGLLVLCKILFGGFRLGGGGRHHWRERWQKMSPEEREALKMKIRERWGKKGEC